MWPSPAPAGRLHFSSLPEYTTTMRGLMLEQMNLALWELARRAHAMLGAGRSAPQLRGAGVSFYARAELTVHRKRSGG